MQGFFQTPDPNPNHTVGWETLRDTRLPEPNPNHTVGWETLRDTRLRDNRRIAFEITVSEKNADAIKKYVFFFCPYFT